MPTNNSKTKPYTVHSTAFKLRGEVTHSRSNWQINFEIKRSKNKATWGKNVKIIFGTYLRENVSVIVKLGLCTFCSIQCSAAEVHTFRDNWMAVFKQLLNMPTHQSGDVLFKVNTRRESSIRAAPTCLL